MREIEHRGRQVSNEIRNWSGSLRLKPHENLEPSSKGEVADIIGRVAGEGWKLRVFGAGRSSSALADTKEWLHCPQEQR